QFVHGAEDASAVEDVLCHGQEVFSRLERLPVPTVALIRGACVGGGVELALACRYRIVIDAPETVLTLSEVSLGVIPGWGGTQRLPRLIGLERALEVILTSEKIDARRAQAIGLTDAVIDASNVESDLGPLLARLATQPGREDAHGEATEASKVGVFE